ncbi:MAG: transcription-repair coupling factor [Alphaproteobacteria bacterium]
MKRLPLDPGAPERLTIGGIMPGQDARLLADLAGKVKGGVLHVARDEERAAALHAHLEFFAPGVEVLDFPAWDCLPYDRVSPRPEILGQRMATLTRMVGLMSRPRPAVIITTVNAFTQRVPGRKVVMGESFEARIHDEVDAEKLQGFLVRHGYNRAATVREPGEFAFRGSIIDIFPPGEEEPLRLDLFGDQVETIRRFDPLTQLSGAAADALSLKPVSEVSLDEESISRFRQGYRQSFGSVNKDPLYEAISEGRKQPGMEHYLPLFHELLEPMTSYLPNAAITLDHQADEAIEARLAQVKDFHDARKEMRETERKAGGTPYNPLPPKALYLEQEELNNLLNSRATGQFSLFHVEQGGQRVNDAGGRKGRDFGIYRNNPEADLWEELQIWIDTCLASKQRVMIATYSGGARERLAGLLSEHGITGWEKAQSWAAVQGLPRETVSLTVLPLESGFTQPGLAVITEQDILGDRIARAKKKRRTKAEDFLTEHSALNEGDLVVHAEHGVGRYEGLETITALGAPHDCLRVVYDGGDKLFVPVENIEILSRYGSDGSLDRLGGVAWQGRKARVKKRLKDMADELMKVAAARVARHAESLDIPDGLWSEFCARFPYHETDDQLGAIEDVLQDLSSNKAMDRLVCGDVGFGKTEIALRAAFLAAMNGVQVALVAPTTLLARQHYSEFKDRFRGFPVRLGHLSRMVPAKEQKRVKDGLKKGEVDIVIGTHALLSKTIKFGHLGLLIVDEEQRFGVRQKERLKQLKEDVHVLTLTATPIPRTLQLALTGVRELSLIATPPVDRLAVRTFCMAWDGMVLREAIMREHFRGGQVFVVCPRISDLTQMQEDLKELVPEIRIAVANGQMPAEELEEVMTVFTDGGADLLLATNIIESGIDIPNANTLIIHRAHMFGLAHLYQLRGRVGRGKQRGYAYMTWERGHKLTKTAEQRLHVLETLDTLGAGFQLASHDMDIRGAGNLLGEEQSGHVKEVGIELYQHMLEEAVAEARARAQGEEVKPADEETWSPQINLGMPVLIPEEYVTDLHVRLSLYRRLSTLKDREAIDAFAAELIDRFGDLPDEVQNLMKVIEIKQFCRRAGVSRVDAGPQGAVVAFRNDTFDNVDGLLAWINDQAGTVKIRPDQRLSIIKGGWKLPANRLSGVSTLMNDLADIAA